MANRIFRSDEISPMAEEVWANGIWASSCPDSGFRVQGSGFRVQGSGVSPPPRRHTLIRPCTPNPKPQTPNPTITPTHHTPDPRPCAPPPTAGVRASSFLLSSLQMSDTRVYALCMRALLETASHFCEAVVLKLRAVPKCTTQLKNFPSDPSWRRCSCHPSR